MPAACKGNALLTDEGCETNGFDNFDKIQFWRTPVAKCAAQDGDVRALLPLGRRTTSPSSAAAEAADTAERRWHSADAGAAPRWRSPHDRQPSRFANVSRHFGAVRAVDGVDLDIAAGEFFAMLGPSGSGKTTCLRLIAGFEQPTAATSRSSARRAEGVPPYERNVNTVFQDYALFPHMSVRDNVAYGLMVKGVAQGRARSASARGDARAGQARRATATRRPGQLSGGQRQRVALARALVNQPKVLLLDEPLGALDLKLREQMQVELKALQQQLGITFVFVTHDQGEALSMADRVAVFNDGKHRCRSARRDEIYERPATALRRRFRRLVQRAAAATSPRAMAARAAGRACGPRRSRVARRATPRRRATRAQPTATISASAITAPARAATSRCRRRAASLSAEAAGHRRFGAGRRVRLTGRRGAWHAWRRAREPLQPAAAIRRRAAALRRALRPVLRARRSCCSLLLLLPPLLWLGIVYLGSLFALLLQSFFSHRRVLRPDRPRVHARRPMRELLAAGQPRHHHAHRGDGGAGHARLRRHRLSDRLLRGALCPRRD